MFVFTSCEQAPEIMPNVASSARVEQETNATEDIKFNGEYLEFKSPDAFNNFLEALPQKKKTDLDTWEASLGFKSMRHYYEIAIDENQHYYEWLRNNMTEQMAKEIQKNGRPHSDYVKKNAALFIFDSKKNFSLNLYDPRLAAVVNADGLVKIGGYIFQYTATQMKVMPAKNKAKINALKNAKADVSSEGIVVKNIEKGARTDKGGRSEATSFSTWIEGESVNYGVYNNIVIDDISVPIIIDRWVRGSVDLYTSYEPIYSCNTISCWTDEENPPYIIGWRINQGFSVWAQQWERTSIQEPLFGIWIVYDYESPTGFLSISSGASPYSGSANSNGEVVGSITFSGSSTTAHNVSGSVTITGYGGSTASTYIQ